MELPTLTISASKGWLNQKERFSKNQAGKEQKNYTLLRAGELSYNHGNSKTAQYGTAFVLRGYSEALVPRIYHSFKMEKNNSADLIEYMFEGKKFDRELRKLVSSGARMDGLLNINFDEFMNVRIFISVDSKEQNLISKLLRELDSLIASNQLQQKSHESNTIRGP